MNLVTRSITRDHALGGVAGSRFLFVAPWKGVSIVGTSQDPFDGRADSLRVRETDVSAFLREVNQAFPAAGSSWTMSGWCIVVCSRRPTTRAGGCSRTAWYATTAPTACPG